MLCELCGAEVPRTKTVSVEGTVLAACSNCARFGTEVGAPPPGRKAAPPLVAKRLEARKRRLSERDVYAQAGEEDLALDYAERIRRAREALGWKQTDLGAKVNERVTVIAKIESGAMVPNDNLSRRLERALNITLREKVPVPTTRKATGSRESLTLGDLIDLDGEE